MRAGQTHILVVSSPTQFEVEHSERHQGFFFFFFTVSSRLFPSLFILLVKLYLRHNYLIATTCLPTRKTPQFVLQGMSFGVFLGEIAF